HAVGGEGVGDILHVVVRHHEGHDTGRFGAAAASDGRVTILVVAHGRALDRVTERVEDGDGDRRPAYAVGVHCLVVHGHRGRGRVRRAGVDVRGWSELVVLLDRVAVPVKRAEREVAGRAGVLRVRDTGEDDLDVTRVDAADR